MTTYDRVHFSLRLCTLTQLIVRVCAARMYKDFSNVYLQEKQLRRETKFHFAKNLK